jgi:hypothetical protein
MFFLFFVISADSGNHCDAGKNGGQCSLLSQGLVRCMNSIIESGTLPVIYQYLPKLLEVFLFHNHPSSARSPSAILSKFSKLSAKVGSLQILPFSITISTSMSLCHASYLPLLQIFFEETYSKLAQMMSPSLSEEDSGELMLTMTKGLKMIILIPLQYCLSNQASAVFSLFFHSPTCSTSSNTHEEVHNTSRDLSSTKTEEREVFSQYRQLFQLFLQLEDLCYEKQYYNEQLNQTKNQSSDGENSVIIINPFQSCEFGRLVLPVCFSVDKDYHNDNDEETKETMTQATLIFNGVWKLYQFLSRFYLIILEYSLTYQQHQSSKLIYQANNLPSSSSSTSESKVSNHCYLFLFNMMTSLLLSSSLAMSRVFSIFTPDFNKDLLSELQQLIIQYKEYWNFLQGIIKQLLKSSPVFMKSFFSLPIIISSKVVFPSFSYVFVGLLKYVLLKVLDRIDDEIEPNVPFDKNRNNLVSFGRFLFEKIIFFISFIKQDGLFNDGNEVPYNREMFCQCCFRSFDAIEKLRKYLLQSGTEDEEEERMDVLEKKDEEIKMVDIHYEAYPPYGRLLEYFNQYYFDQNKSKGGNASDVNEIDAGNNSKKRKFINVSNISALQSVIENASKKQIKQGIIPIMYNSVVERINHDQQSQDNHVFSLNSQFYNSQQGNVTNNTLAMKLFNSQKSQGNSESSQKFEGQHNPVSAFSSAKQLLQQTVEVSDPLPPVPIFVEQSININNHPKEEAERVPLDMEISEEINAAETLVKENLVNPVPENCVTVPHPPHPKMNSSNYDQILLVLQEMQADCQLALTPQAVNGAVLSRCTSSTSRSSSPSLSILNDMFQKSQKLQSFIVSLILKNQDGSIQRTASNDETLGNIGVDK